MSRFVLFNVKVTRETMWQEEEEVKERTALPVLFLSDGDMRMEFIKGEGKRSSRG